MQGTRRDAALAAAVPDCSTSTRDPTFDVVEADFEHCFACLL